MKRFTKKLPGHDCIRHPCGKRGCGTYPGSNHGISSEEWIYAVSNGDVALSLRVTSGIYPKSVPRDCQPADGATGNWLHEHHSFPTSEAHVLGEPEPCEYLDSGACYSEYGQAIAAEEFFSSNGGPKFEQPESFWLELELELQDRTKRLREERVDHKIAKCHRCDGSGVVKHQAAIVDEVDLVEALAALEHDWWSRWEMYREVTLNDQGGTAAKRWSRLRDLPYDSLVDHEKTRYRREARKTIALLRKLGVLQ